MDIIMCFYSLAMSELMKLAGNTAELSVENMDRNSPNSSISCSRNTLPHSVQDYLQTL